MPYCLIAPSKTASSPHERGRVRLGGAGARLGTADLDGDDRLVPLVRLPGGVQETAAAGDTFEIGEDHLRIVAAHQAVDQLGDRKVHLVAGVEVVGYPDAEVLGGVEHEAAEGAALAEEGDRALHQVGVLVERGGEGGQRPLAGGDHAEAVGAEHPYPALRDRGLQVLLELHAPATDLGEPRAAQDGGRDAAPAAGADGVGGLLGRQHDHGEVDVPVDVVQTAVGGEALHLIALGVDGKDPAREPEPLEVVDGPPRQLRRGVGGAEDRDGAGAQKCVQGIVGAGAVCVLLHGSSSGLRDTKYE